MTEKPQGKGQQARGGHARAEALTPEQRRAIAQKAARSRWDAGVPEATHQGTFQIGNATLKAAVLPNGQRLLTQSTFLVSLGRARTPKAGTGVLATVDQTPFFLQAEVLKPFISEELSMSTTPVFYRDLDGKRAVGYDARLLPMVAEVYLKLRDDCVANNKPIPKQYRHIVQACDILMRGLAHVGILALVDEATGYQYDRARRALEEILQTFISKELIKWVKTFPDEFYQQLFRLKKKSKDALTNRRPLWVGKLTLNLVYQRLAPGVREELQRLTPRDAKGRLKHKLFQRLTEDVGHPKLREHFIRLLTLMQASDDWETFYKMLNKALPPYRNMPLLQKQIEEEDAAAETAAMRR